MASTLVLVGWDEVKCRPIYRNIPKSTGKLEQQVKKLEVKIKKSVGAGARHGKAFTAAPTAPLEEEELSSLGNAKGGTYGQPRAGKTVSKRGRSRTISLSPVVQAAGKKVRWGDHNANDAAHGVIITDEKTLISLAVEDEAIKNARDSTISITFTRKRKKGYGTKASASAAAARSLIGWGGYENVDFASSNNNNDEAVESLINRDSSPLQVESGEETELECSEGNSGLPPVNDERIDSDVSIQSRILCSPPSSGSHCEREETSQPSEEKEIGCDVSSHGRLSYSPNSNVSFDSYQHSEEPTQRREQSPMQDSGSDVYEDKSINFGDLMKKEAPVANSSTSTPSKLQSSPTSIDTLCAIDTPNRSGIGQHQQDSAGLNSRNDTPLTKGEESTISPNAYELDHSTNDFAEDESINSTKNEVPVANSSISTPSKLQGQHSSPTSIETRRALDTPNSSSIGQHQQDSPGLNSRNDTPLTKGEESTISPNVYGRDHSPNSDFDVTFDEPESHALRKERRRSYGDVKPVSMSNKYAAATTAAASDGSAKVIGWDDAKCRPIYNAPPARNAQSEDSPDSYSPANKGDGSHMRNKRTQKKRVYTSLFKKTGLSQAARDKMEIDSPFSIRSPNAPSGMERGCHVTTSMENSNCIDFAKKASNSGEAEAIIDSDQQNDTLLNVDLEMEAIINDSNAHRAQPTSKTSLESARAFFRYLDSNHNLTILDQSEPTLKTKTSVIRTKRKIEECGQLRAQYLEYCRTVQDTGVRPISLNEFAQNWNLYFMEEKGVFRDGLLDED